jgi:hypothetical protein
MQFLLCMALLFAARPVLAQEDWEEGLTEARLVGDADPNPVQLPTPQLVKHDRTTPVVLGVTAAIGGGFSLVGAWAMYIARQNYRQRAWLDVSPDTLSEWREQGAWSFWLGVSGAGLLVTSEYFLLPESNSVPGYAWLAGAGWRLQRSWFWHRHDAHGWLEWRDGWALGTRSSLRSPRCSHSARRRSLSNPGGEAVIGSVDFGLEGTL